jgi:ribosomal protein S12 methylthiotransferase
VAFSYRKGHRPFHALELVHQAAKPLPDTIELWPKPSPPTAPTVGFISLRCPKNLVDSEVMLRLLDRADNLEFILEVAPC